MEYIIDFDRLNQLTATFKSDNNTFAIANGNTISRNILKDYMDYFINKSNSKIESDKLNNIIKTLVYNKIIIGEDTIRDQKIDEILETNEDRNSLVKKLAGSLLTKYKI